MTPTLWGTVELAGWRKGFKEPLEEETAGARVGMGKVPAGKVTV